MDSQKFKIVIKRDEVEKYPQQIAKILLALEKPEAMVTDLTTFRDFWTMADRDDSLAAAQMALDATMRNYGLPLFKVSMKLVDAAKQMKAGGM